MPCDQLRLISVDIGKTDPDTMHAALKALGLNPIRQGDVIRFGRNESISCRTGAVQLSQSRDIAEIKQAYSRQTITATAKKYGWQLKEVSPNKFQVLKRY